MRRPGQLVGVGGFETGYVTDDGLEGTGVAVAGVGHTVRVVQPDTPDADQQRQFTTEVGRRLTARTTRATAVTLSPTG